ncbi:odorant receptor 67d [Hermetia illucens]|uniref:odorant receptor 67d n=1 Tax=Hermetia illucens TaxID=343691 RepID=UPI0018CC3BC9|nr:odorant receptor 67d [Hermetia illucens]
MNHSRNFEVGMQIVYRIFTIFGLNIFDPTYKVTWRTLCCIGLALFGNLNVFYTLFSHRNNFMMTLRCLCAAPEAFQGVVKLFTIMKHGKMMASTIDFVRSVYRKNEQGGSGRLKVLEDCSAKLAYGMLETIFAFTGNNTCDLVLCILIIHISLLVGIFKEALNETKKLIGSESHVIRRSLRNCILMHQDLINYISAVNGIYSTTFFYQTATASLSLALNCFCIVKTDWLGAYGFAVFSLMKIFTFCILGTFVEIMNNETLRTLTDFPWYLLPIDCQKMFYMSLMRSNKFSKLMIAKVAPLNVATGAEIIKAIYSYLMMLLNVQEKGNIYLEK